MILLNEEGEVFRRNGALIRPLERQGIDPKWIDVLTKDPYAIFFKTPFHQAVLGTRGVVLEEFDLAPSDLHS